MKKFSRIFAIITLLSCLASAEPKKADRSLAWEFLVKIGQSSVNTRVVFLQVASFYKMTGNILAMNGYPINDPSFWAGYNLESSKIANAHLNDIQNKTLEYVRENFTDAELKELNLIFSKGVAKKFMQIWSKGDYMLFYNNQAVSDKLFEGSMSYAKKKLGVNTILKAEPSK